MVGGDKRKIHTLSNTLNAYYKSLIYMGKSGNGQLTKMVNQICVASIIQGLSEGIHLALNKNLNIQKLIEVLKNGAGQSWQLENRALTMSKNKFDFVINLAAKRSKMHSVHDIVSLRSMSS